MKTALPVILLSLLTAQVLAGENQLLVLSGGGYPDSNHYSQYLQTKTVYESLSKTLPYKVDLFFGAGNDGVGSAPYADVHKIEKSGALTFEKYIVGDITGNKAATKANVVEYFKSAVAPELETFFMVVSDHGVPNKVNGQRDETYSNNCIDLWNAKLENGKITDIGSFSDSRCLSKDELKGLLTTQVKAKRKVFAMSQCFSGGFHQMSVSEAGTRPTADKNICGFTAVTHDTWASGCSPDVDGPSYQGYERSFTEQLTGIDYVNNKKLREPRDSFQDAHEAAILEDLTVDIPLATSDYFLWRWALKLEKDDQAKETFYRGADHALVLNDAGFGIKSSLFKKMEKSIVGKFPELKEVLNQPLRVLESEVKKLSSELTALEEEMGKLGDVSSKMFFEHTFSLWVSELEGGSSLDLSPEELKIETMIQTTGGSANLKYNLLPILWVQDPVQAEAVSLYLSQRIKKISEFALAHAGPVVVDRTQEMLVLDNRVTELDEKRNHLGYLHGLSRRMMIYRQILGAWVALDSTNQKQALKELDGLLDCEGTKL